MAENSERLQRPPISAMNCSRCGQSRAWGVVTPCHSVRSSFSAGRLRDVQGTAQKRSALTECRVTNGRLSSALLLLYLEKLMKREMSVSRSTISSLDLALVLTLACLSTNANAAVNKNSHTAQSSGSADVTAAKRIIKSSLIDPTSAQFEVAPSKTVIGTDGRKTTLVCGTYNAKNRFGGYVGRVSFAYSSSAQAVFTSKVARLSADGSSISLAGLGDSLNGTPSFDQISSVQARGAALQKEVQFWLGRCEA